MKSLVYDYPSVQREINAYEAISKFSLESNSKGKQYVRQALDHFELRRGERNYHFLIHEPLGVTAQTFLEICGGRLPIEYVRDLAFQMLHALEFIHDAGVVYAGSDPFSH